ncbi:MAG: carboxypeptidase regulatory-like domain-containing protein [Candidatus Riflebacteria bacterium]|nr:carboxypeptidase regulatory-like domain-containing protein [Candidatus Riflebacteria bacterium]
MAFNNSRFFAIGLLTSCTFMCLLGCSDVGHETTADQEPLSHGVPDSISALVRERIHAQVTNSSDFSNNNPRSSVTFSENSINADSTHELSGRVVDAITSMPVAGTALLAGNRVMNGDADGYFHILGCKPEERLDLLVTAEGYTSLAIKTRPVEAENAPMEIRLNPVLSSLHGRVISSLSGKPVAGATIALNDTCVVTGTNGRFILKKVRSGYHSVTISALSHIPVKKLVFIDEGKSSRVFKLDPDLKASAD